MINLDILIIENDPIWVFKLQNMLRQLNKGSNQFVRSLAEARQQLETQIPDLVIADIVLPDGISVSLFTQKYKQLPIVFQTGFKNEDVLKKVLKIPNVYFLAKPFQQFDLQVAMELLISRTPNQTVSTSLGISVTGKHRQTIQIPLHEIYWIKGEGNYVIISTNNQKYVLKKSLRKVAENLSLDFIQVQKSYIINRSYIDNISNMTVQIKQDLIPIGRAYKKKLLVAIAP